jgi:hypothetical protein
VWHILDETFLPENEVMSNLVCHVGGYALMVALGVANTLHGGINRERYRLTDGIMIARFYLTYFFSKESNIHTTHTQTEERYMRLAARAGRTCSLSRTSSSLSSCLQPALSSS